MKSFGRNNTIFVLVGLLCFTPLSTTPHLYIFQEIWCLLHGLLYFLAIPSMSMLMMIFALGNLNDISWGTRDAGATATAPPQNSQQQGNTKLNDIRRWVMGPSSPTNKTTSDYQFSFGNLFR